MNLRVPHIIAVTVTLTALGAWAPGSVQAQSRAPVEVTPDMALPALGPDRLRLVPPTPRATIIRQAEEESSGRSRSRMTGRQAAELEPARPSTGPATPQSYRRAPGPERQVDEDVEYGRLIVITSFADLNVTIDGQPYPFGSMRGVLLYANEQYEVLLQRSSEGDSAATAGEARVITVRVRPGETRVLMANLGDEAGSVTAPRQTDRRRSRAARRDRDEDEDEDIGYLGVSSSPRGIVYVDGDNTGQMTPARRIELDPGRHEVRIFYESEDRFSETKNVLIRAGVNTNVFFRMRRDEDYEDEE